MTTSEYKPNKKEQRFQRYYDELIRQTLHARAHLKLFERLENYRTDYPHELRKANHFFGFTIKAHLDDALMTLSRILDDRRRRDPLTIWKFLNFAEQNLGIFSNEAFSKRTKGKSDYYDSLVESHKPIARREIEKDRQKLNDLESTINNLITWRDKVIAHIDPHYLRSGKRIDEDYPLEIQQLNEAIDTVAQTLNRYSQAYHTETWLKEYLGENDIQEVMNAIRFRIQERKKQLEEFRKQASDKT